MFSSAKKLSAKKSVTVGVLQLVQQHVAVDRVSQQHDRTAQYFEDARRRKWGSPHIVPVYTLR